MFRLRSDLSDRSSDVDQLKSIAKTIVSELGTIKSSVSHFELKLDEGMKTLHVSGLEHHSRSSSSSLTRNSSSSSYASCTPKLPNKTPNREPFLRSDTPVSTISFPSSTLVSEPFSSPNFVPCSTTKLTNSKPEELFDTEDKENLLTPVPDHPKRPFFGSPLKAGSEDSLRNTFPRTPFANPDPQRRETFTSLDPQRRTFVGTDPQRMPLNSLDPPRTPFNRLDFRRSSFAELDSQIRTPLMDLDSKRERLPDGDSHRKPSHSRSHTVPISFGAQRTRLVKLNSQRRTSLIDLESQMDRPRRTPLSSIDSQINILNETLLEFEAGLDSPRFSLISHRKTASLDIDTFKDLDFHVRPAVGHPTFRFFCKLYYH